MARGAGSGLLFRSARTRGCKHRRRRFRARLAPAYTALWPPLRRGFFADGFIGIVYNCPLGPICIAAWRTFSAKSSVSFFLVDGNEPNLFRAFQTGNLPAVCSM